MKLRTCVDPFGRFVLGIHRPSYRVDNLRAKTHVRQLGILGDNRTVDNRPNFPEGDIAEDAADWIYEIPNPFPFRGTTFILKSWADAKVQDPSTIAIPAPRSCSFCKTVRGWYGDAGLAENALETVFRTLPDPLRLAVATSSTDPEDLRLLAEQCCEFIPDPETGWPKGLVYETDADGRPKPVVRDIKLFEALANNGFLPDAYKEAMVLRPGAQGGSEIVGDWRNGSHIYEYLRRNSYIPWGHYAANLADDNIRYRIEELSSADVTGMRHLYYQRTYVRMARDLGLNLPADRRSLSPESLEVLRRAVLDTLRHGGAAARPSFVCTLWGWNFGFDYSPSRYRLHASHQQIHQQYALVPAAVAAETGEPARVNSFEAFCCGDLIRDFVRQYRLSTGKPFFETYIKAITNNRRIDGRSDKESSLVVHRDERVMVFVPKAQTSQWELQLMTLVPAGNILETDDRTRASLDRAILITMKILAALGARMITVIEYAKRFDSHDEDQRLLYAFLPRLPESPGAFSEAQMRWISGHYPEDFAAACRRRLSEVASQVDPAGDTMEC